MAENYITTQTTAASYIACFKYSRYAIPYTFLNKHIIGCSVVSVVSVVMKKSAQQLMDERMCRPGYRWNDTLKRCIGSYGPGNETDIDAEIPKIKPVPEPVPVDNPTVKNAQGKSGGRGNMRMNANGVVQSGTKMGKSLKIT